MGMNARPVPALSGAWPDLVINAKSIYPTVNVGHTVGSRAAKGASWQIEAVVPATLSS